MEDWSFPPRYDGDYVPPADSRYWFPQRETMPASDRERRIVLRLQQVTRYAWDRSPFYRAKWEEAGFHPDHLKSLEDFECKVPVVREEGPARVASARASVRRLSLIPQGEIHHIHGTSGTTGRPTAFAIGRSDWDAIADAHARIMWAMGVRPGDTVFVGAIFSLYMGSWGALGGAERLRCKAFPFGAGAPGMTARAAMWLDSMKPQAFYGTPSFALHLAEVARGEGYEPRDFGLKVMFFSGEPGASVPGVRDRIADAYGARVIDCGSMAEMTPFMNVSGTAETDGMLCWQDIVYTEVCDPTTFRRVAYGERGTPVYTHLERTSQPMIRLVSGDLTLWDNGPNPCGRTYPRLPQGIFGRIDDMFTIRGENVYPSEVDAVMNALDGYGGEHRIVITRDGAMDELMIRVEASPGQHAKGVSGLGCAARRSGEEAAEDAWAAGESRSGRAGDVPAHRLQGPPRDRRPRRLPRHERKACARRPLMGYVPSATLVAGVLAGNVRAIARLLSRAESGSDEARPALDEIFRHAGRAHVVGITGVPGSGKSTLVAKLAQAVRGERPRASASSRSIRRARFPAALDSRRSHPHGRSRGRRGRLRAQHGHPRLARRDRARHARSGRHPRCGGLRHRGHRDGRRRPGRSRGRARRSYHGRGIGAGIG